MAKLTLTMAPTFKERVLIPIPGSRSVDTEFIFKGRTRDQFNEFLDTLSGRDDVDVLMDILAGWELEDEFNRENVQRLTQVYAGSARAIIERYMRAVSGARTGN